METLLYYRHNLKIPQAEIQFHYINYDEITIVLEGTLSYTINGIDIDVNPGDIIYVKRGSSRKRKPIEQVNYVSLNFSPNRDYPFPVLLEQALTEPVRLLLASMDAVYHFTHNLSDERFTLLLQCLVKQLETQLKAEKEHPLVVDIKKYVRNHISEKITLVSICNHIFFSPVYCENIFKRETGTSIIDYALGEKIKIAKTLLIEGTTSLTKVAELIGFADYNYFSRLFKKKVGISPLAYKKQNATFEQK